MNTEKKRQKRFAGKRKVFDAVQFSARLYVKIDNSKVHLFRYLLEAQDNLGIMTVADRWGAVLLVRYSPHQEKEMLEFLQGMQDTVQFTIIPLPANLLHSS